MDLTDYLLLRGGDTAVVGSRGYRPHSHVPLGTLATDGPIFRLDAEPWRWRGVTAFGLLHKFAGGEDVSGFLADFAGFSVLRVFNYTPAKDWGAAAWDPAPFAATVAFLARCAQSGFFVELVLLTDDDPTRVAPARHLVEALAAVRPTNLLLEIGNEPTTHKAIDTRALKPACDASGFHYSSGDYEDSSRFFGSFLTCHPGRDSDWPRRAHDLLEYYIGGGPNALTDPAHRCPIVADEPIRPDQAGGNREQDFRAYFATCALLGAGATFHFESGKLGNRPTTDEQRFAAIALGAMNSFPADAPRAPYRRLTAEQDPHSLRTYEVGPYMVRIRPTTLSAPEPGWRPLDRDGILWQR